MIRLVSCVSLWFGLLLSVAMGCGKSDPATTGGASKRVTPRPDAETAPPRRPPTPRPPRFWELSRRLVPDPKDFTFIVFGDSRQGFCACDRSSIKPDRCRVRFPASPDKLVQDCDLVSRAPALLLGEVARQIRPKAPAATRADFGLFTGDLVYRGSCAKDWAWAKSVFLDKADTRRIFLAPGNHDTWHRDGEPSPWPPVQSAFPHLLRTEKGQQLLPHYYAFRAGSALFVTLCTGGYPKKGTHADFLQADREWLCVKADFATQMRWLDQVLAYGARQGVRHVFVQYHKPSFSCSRHPPLAEKHDPLTRLRPFKRAHPRINVMAFSGHNHTTSVYVSGGVTVAVVGGGGAPQHFRSGPKACHPDKPDQPPELFWGTSKRTVRYNYFWIQVRGGQLTVQERCLARAGDGFTFENGAQLTARGKVLGRAGACDLSVKMNKK